jgi:arylsulfatase A-like enzyme
MLRAGENPDAEYRQAGRGRDAVHPLLLRRVRLCTRPQHPDDRPAHGHTAVRNNGLDRYLDDQDVTIAEVLNRAGYATGGFGKWGLGREDTPGVAVKQGFDTWFGQYSQVHAHFHFPSFMMRDLEQVPLAENLGKKRGKYAQDAIH